MQSPTLARPSGLSAKQQQLVSLVQRDYEITQEIASSAENAVVASRSVGFTLVAALLGVGLTQKSWPLLLAASVAALAVYQIDGYYTWRASERDKYARRLEDVLATYFAAIKRHPRNERDLVRLDRKLAGLRIGVTSEIRTFRVRDTFYNQPASLFRVLYPGLLLFALGACLYFGFRDLGDDDGGSQQRPQEVLVAEPQRPSATRQP